ncbi:MAG: Sir2 family NAD-dependent protein deacetylase, partial [Thermoplasmata archaeon]
RMETYEPLPSIPPFCQCGAVLRPDVVLFEEPLDEVILRKAFEAAENAEVFLSIGTSAVVYPAAYLPLEAKRNGGFLIEINPEPTPLSQLADAVFREKAGEILPLILERLRK